MIGGCLKQIGCLVVLVVLAVAGWFTRDMWWDRVTGRNSTTSAEIVWTPISEAPASKARERVSALSKRGGAVYANLTPAEVASLLLAESGGKLPASVSDVEAAIVDDRISVRATVDLSDFKSAEGLGPLRELLTGSQRVTVTGTPLVAGEGQGRLRVHEVRIGDLPIPRALVSRVLSQVYRTNSSAGVGDEPSIDFPLPSYIGDMRVANGRLTLYKTTS